MKGTIRTLNALKVPFRALSAAKGILHGIGAREGVTTRRPLAVVRISTLAS